MGGSSVTCVGTDVASGSPKDARAARSCSPYGAGIEMATPIVRSVWLLTLTRPILPYPRSAMGFSAPRGQEAHAVVDGGQRLARHRPGLVGSGGQDVVERARVVEVGERALTERRRAPR